MRKLWLMIRSIALPIVVLMVGAVLMSILSGHGYVTEQLRENADPGDRNGLNMRFLGYDTNAATRHWAALDERALRSERRFLELDLIFPAFYGAALAFALATASFSTAIAFRDPIQTVSLRPILKLVIALPISAATLTVREREGSSSTYFKTPILPSKLSALLYA